jgi:hypothetical protein
MMTTPAMSKEVAMGRLMKGSEMFMAKAQANAERS